MLFHIDTLTEYGDGSGGIAAGILMSVKNSWDSPAPYIFIMCLNNGCLHAMVLRYAQG
jgi:hypothetical protein